MSTEFSALELFNSRHNGNYIYITQTLGIVPPPVCNINAMLVEISEGVMMCDCIDGYDGDGVTNCTG